MSSKHDLPTPSKTDLTSSGRRCNKRLLRVFVQVTFFYVFNVFLFLKNLFPRFFCLKNVKCKLRICKNPTKNTLKGCLSNHFAYLLGNCAWQCHLDFPFWKAFSCYWLTLRYVLRSDNMHMTQCAKIIVGFMANVGNVFIKRLQSFLLFFSRF